MIESLSAPLDSAALAWAATGMAGIILVVVFLVSPFSVVLNVITVPLGYEFQSCPNCPAFGVEKITYTECAGCGKEIAENFSSGLSPSGSSEMHHFCDDCTVTSEAVAEQSGETA